MPNVRRIAVVSMPCDSGGASLIALGAIRHRLSIVGANDSGAHFRRLMQIAAQNSATAFLRHATYNGRFRLAAPDKNGGLWVERVAATANAKRLSRTVIFPWNAKEWQIEGEPPVTELQGRDLPYRAFYERIIEGCEPLQPSNLTNSDSAISLAGRVAGEAATRDVTSGIRFKAEGQEIDLSRLLTVHSWSLGAISRITFFNTRTGQFDRYPVSPALVVADGDLAFHRVLTAKEFANSDVVCVMQRAIERDRLELLGNKIAELAQWYSPDTDRLGVLPAPPTGIHLSLLRRGQS